MTAVAVMTIQEAHINVEWLRKGEEDDANDDSDPDKIGTNTRRKYIPTKIFGMKVNSN